MIGFLLGCEFRKSENLRQLEIDSLQTLSRVGITIN